MFTYILDTQVSIPVSTVRTLHRSICDVETSVHGFKSVYTRNSETRTVLNYAHTVNKLEVFFKFVQLHFPPISSCVGEHSNDTGFFSLFQIKNILQGRHYPSLQANTCKCARNKTVPNKWPDAHNLLYQRNDLIFSRSSHIQTYTKTLSS